MLPECVMCVQYAHVCYPGLLCLHTYLDAYVSVMYICPVSFLTFLFVLFHDCVIPYSDSHHQGQGYVNYPSVHLCLSGDVYATRVLFSFSDNVVVGDVSPETLQ